MKPIARCPSLFLHCWRVQLIGLVLSLFCNCSSVLYSLDLSGESRSSEQEFMRFPELLRSALP